MGEQVANEYYLSCMKQGYKWYEDPFYDKYPLCSCFDENISLPSVRCYLADDFYKIPTHVCSCKVAR